MAVADDDGWSQFLRGGPDARELVMGMMDAPSRAKLAGEREEGSKAAVFLPCGRAIQPKLLRMRQPPVGERSPTIGDVRMDIDLGLLLSAQEEFDTELFACDQINMKQIANRPQEMSKSTLERMIENLKLNGHCEEHSFTKSDWDACWKEHGFNQTLKSLSLAQWIQVVSNSKGLGCSNFFLHEVLPFIVENYYGEHHQHSYEQLEILTEKAFESSSFAHLNLKALNERLSSLELSSINGERINYVGVHLENHMAKVWRSCNS